MRSIELFAGAGGLALGTSLAGFKHELVVERDRYCCDTIRHNTELNTNHVREWPLVESSVETIEFSKYEGKLDLVSGGPPCQPFSIGGKHKAFRDKRDMFPQAVRCVRETRPKAFLFENVRGLVRPAFFNYFSYICLQLEFPMMVRRDEEPWEEHYRRLQHEKSSGTISDLKYNVLAKVLNAADFGVSQRRERVFIVGFRSDLGVEWSFPEGTHSEDSLLYEQFISGQYWDEFEIPRKYRRKITPQIHTRLRKIDPTIRMIPLSRWKTVRDAISDLPDPVRSRFGVPNHKYQPGARSYPGHTGSPIDEPSKTLKAGDHGVPGGENTVRLGNGQLRYYTVREAARIQTFPDEFVFHGSWTETMRQLGNAVPVRLANVVADGISEALRRE